MAEIPRRAIVPCPDKSTHTQTQKKPTKRVIFHAKHCGSKKKTEKQNETDKNPHPTQKTVLNAKHGGREERGRGRNKMHGKGGSKANKQHNQTGANTNGEEERGRGGDFVHDDVNDNVDVVDLEVRQALKACL